MSATVWEKMAAPLPSTAISWRQDGKPTERQGKWFARFVCYVEAGTVRERLDSIVPGEWDLTLELLPAAAYTADEDITVNFKAKLQVLGVVREDVGTGKDYKSAATDAFKRAAVRFGIGHELYAFEQNWVQVDGDGKFAKPVEDPQKTYERRYGSGAKVSGPPLDNPAPGVAAGGAPSPFVPGETENEPTISCPKCGGRMWDNRLTKRNVKAPDWKCQNRSCDGVIWPPKATARAAAPVSPVDDGDVRGSLEAVDRAAYDEPLPF